MKKKKKNKNKILIAIFAVLFVIIALVVGISIYVKSCLKPTDAFLNGQVCEEGQDVPCDFTVFIVDEGAYGKSTLDKLQEKGIYIMPNAVKGFFRVSHMGVQSHADLDQLAAAIHQATQS